jgi:hypothetical protein
MAGLSTPAIQSTDEALIDIAWRAQNVLPRVALHIRKSTFLTANFRRRVSVGV